MMPTWEPRQLRQARQTRPVYLEIPANRGHLGVKSVQVSFEASVATVSSNSEHNTYGRLPEMARQYRFIGCTSSRVAQSPRGQS